MKKSYFKIIILLISLTLYLSTTYIIGVISPESNLYTSWTIFGLCFVIVESFLIGVITNRHIKSIKNFFIYFFLIPTSTIIISFLVSIKFPNVITLSENSQGESIVSEIDPLSLYVYFFGALLLLFIIAITVIGLIYLKWFNSKTK